MGFFANLFSGQQRNDSPLAGQPDLDFYEKLVDNVAASDEFQIELKAALKMAFQDPKTFYDDSGEISLSDRGLNYLRDGSSTPKFVLIDKMLAVGQMAEVDWKEEEEEIRFSIIEIAKAKGYDMHISTDDTYSMDTDKIIKSINDNEIKPLGYCLEILDINSDSYVFTIVPLDKQQLVRGMFDKLK
jgi:hypothetical protein